MADIEKAARDGYSKNEECCGYLEGPDSDPLLVDRAITLENLANKYHAADPKGHPRTGRDYFKINALKFGRAIEEGDRLGRPVKVFFHSHLDSGAYFSEEDVAAMTFNGTADPAYPLAYLVTAVDLGLVTDHKLFVWDRESRKFIAARFSTIEG